MHHIFQIKLMNKKIVVQQVIRKLELRITIKELKLKTYC